ncbi:MAG: ABC transporter substrate-binding protein [Dehalococcoidia bacterium]
MNCRQNLAIGMCLSFAAMAIMACGGGSKVPVPLDATNAPTAAVTFEPESRTIVVGVTSELICEDPWLASPFTLSGYLNGIVNRPLYAIRDERLIPMLAADFPAVSTDGLTYAIPIRPNMTWQNGDALDARDFELGLRRSCNREFGRHSAHVLVNVEGCTNAYEGSREVVEVGVRAVDSLTLQIRLIAAQPSFPSILALPLAYPAPDERLESTESVWPTIGEAPCSGPFCVADWVEGSRVELVRNDHWKLGGPNLRAIEFQVYADVVSALAAFDAGNVHLVEIADPGAVAGRSDVILQLQSATNGLAFRTGQPALQDTNVRLALSRAIDRTRLDGIAGTTTRVGTTNWVPMGVPGANAGGAFDIAIGFDPVAAQGALTAAGYPNGEGFPAVQFAIRDREQTVALAESLSDQWERVLNIDIPVSVVSDEIWQQAIATRGEFDLVLDGWVQDYPDAANWLLTPRYPSGEEPCRPANLDLLLDAVAPEYGNDDRWQTLQAIELAYVPNLCFMIPLYHTADLYLLSDRVTGAHAATGAGPLPPFPESWQLSD